MKKFTILLLIIFSQSIFAGSGSGKITRVYTHHSDIAIYKTEFYTSIPSCNLYGEFAISLATNTGRATHTQVLTAVAMGKNVVINGTGTCTYLGRENMRFIFFDN